MVYNTYYQSSFETYKGPIATEEGYLEPEEEYKDYIFERNNIDSDTTDNLRDDLI
jgi:hypothetical protein